MDSFWITVLVMFFIVLLASYIKSMSRDRCLKDFDGSLCISVFKNGDSVWGILDVKPTGSILRYPKPHDNIDHFETSFIIYRNEYQTLKGVFRPVEDMNKVERMKRNIQSITLKSGFFNNLRKGFRNFFAAARDAIVETLGTLTGKLYSKSSVISKNKKHLENIEKGVVEFVGYSYDPILESLVGKKVVYEILEGEKWVEYVGILKNYSKDFLEIFSTRYPVEMRFKIKETGQTVEHFKMRFSRTAGTLKIRNDRSSPVKVGDELVVEPGDEVMVTVPMEGEIEVRIVLFEEVDVVFPRSVAIVRHSAE